MLFIKTYCHWKRQNLSIQYWLKWSFQCNFLFGKFILCLSVFFFFNFYWISLYNIHVFVPEKEDACEIIDELEKKHKRLKSNFRVHWNKPVMPYECNICLLQFKDKLHLFNHMFVEHCVDNPLQGYERHSCPRCKKSYRHRSTMLRHVRVECGIEPQFQCGFCSYRCKQRENLKSHFKRRHSGELTLAD